MPKVMGKTGEFDAPHAMLTGLDWFKSIILINKNHNFNQIDKINVDFSQNR